MIKSLYNFTPFKAKWEGEKEQKKKQQQIKHHINIM